MTTLTLKGTKEELEAIVEEINWYNEGCFEGCEVNELEVEFDEYYFCITNGTWKEMENLRIVIETTDLEYEKLEIN